MPKLIKKAEPRKTQGLLKELKIEVERWETQQNTMTSSNEKLKELGQEYLVLQDQIRVMIIEMHREMTQNWSKWTVEHADAYLTLLKADVGEMKE